MARQIPQQHYLQTEQFCPWNLLIWSNKFINYITFDLPNLSITSYKTYVEPIPKLDCIQSISQSYILKKTSCKLKNSHLFGFIYSVKYFDIYITHVYILKLLYNSTTYFNYIFCTYYLDISTHKRMYVYFNHICTFYYQNYLRQLYFVVLCIIDGQNL